MSNLEYRSGIATKIFVPELSDEKVVEFIKSEVGFSCQWCEYVEEEDWWDVSWFDKKTKQEVVRANGDWYLVKYKDYDNDCIQIGHRTITNDIVFACVYYNGGTCFETELNEIINKLDDEH